MIKVESILKEELGKAIVNIALRDIKTWAKKELTVLRYNLKYPIILTCKKNKLLIGNYTIEFCNNHANIVSKENNFIHSFYSKKAAVLFCLYEKLRQINKGSEILSIDKKVSQFYTDYLFYESKLDDKKYKLDMFKKQLYYSRYYESKVKFQTHLRELEKTIIDAKYMKIWDKIL